MRTDINMTDSRWLPLEANPEVMNKYVEKLGMKMTWKFCDVYGLDEDLLAMVPQPVCSVLLLFPVNRKHEEYREQEARKLEEQHVDSDIYFMKQTIGNACGTIGILHALCNNQDKLEFDDGYLKDFIARTNPMSPDERGAHLEGDEGITEAHEDSAQEGQTEAPHRDASVDLHFIALVHRGGNIYELDGRKPSPINHGPSSAGSFLKDAARVCKDFMARDPSEMRFTVVALARGDN
ncbi:ubiquitin carboxyl-terminal hydrolase isozyme L3-like [Corticium candelabrum]|uniref:ubiquitin carboxyl-terminal hydrolase isozyme L3-like n=1 Tax=Corticium candelabrum TaxID=121492 RepID=UPI002E2618BD|nr:ubiquitin carboxyl-terminal hydrolase isozyme L3-like [Corticium candelabrum]